jgi:chloramphenicol-sensitive protein RarD
VSEARLGTWYAIGAYTIWGGLPLYLHLLAPATPLEILGHRIVWSFVLLIIGLAVLRRWQRLTRPAGSAGSAGCHPPGLGRAVRSPRTVAALTLAAVLIATNWGFYIYGVGAQRVVEVSLGYFINPLISVVLGVVFFRERLRRWQWVAVGIGTVAVGVLTVDYGHLPWIALILAVSFGSYGLLKKLVGAPAAEGMTIETGALLLPGLAYLAFLETTHRATFGHAPALTTALLVGTGVITAVPLLLFAGAANRVPLAVLGICQYLTPTLQLLIGVFVFGEPMPPARLAGFVLVWTALAVFTFDAFRHRRASIMAGSASDQTHPAPRSAASGSCASAST